MAQVNNLEELTLHYGEYTATITPQANMVLSSFTKNNTELLGQREHLKGYVEELKSFAMPFLSPWANRVANPYYTVEDMHIKFDFKGMKVDENNYPIHGLMTAIQGWETRTEITTDSVKIVGTFKYNQTIPNYESYPFNHEVTITYILSNDGLKVVTEIHNTGEKTLPVAFGWHPHFITQKDTVSTQDIKAVIPVNSQVFPTETFNPDDTDPYTAMHHMKDNWIVTMETQQGRLSIQADNYPYMLIWFPANTNFVAVEPMTANIDPFNNKPILLPATEIYKATFTIKV